jgi:hypothetical protein
MGVVLGQAGQSVRSEDGPVATISLQAEPVDYADQKKALANTLRTLPRWDPIFIDPQSRDDDDLVLEGYPLRWHIDPVTHVVTTTDEIIGEDGLEEFLASEMRYAGFSLDLSNVPSPSVTVNAEIKWTQQGQGQVDLTSHFISNWPGVVDGALTSYTFQAGSWPSIGASMGDGWKVASATCRERYDLTVRSNSFNSTLKVDWGDWTGDFGAGGLGLPGGSSSTQVTASGSDDTLSVIPPGSITFPDITTQDSTNITRDSQAAGWTDNPDENEVDAGLGFGTDDITSFSRSTSYSGSIIPKHYLIPTIAVGYQAGRPMTENVTLTLTADIQPVVGDSSQGQALEPINLTSVDLSAPLEDNTTGDIPIGDPRLRSYICTDRGQLSIQYMIARAQVALLHAARCIPMTFSPLSLDRWIACTLRKNARIHPPEIPGGSAEGKITGRTLAMSRGSGRIDMSVTATATVGHGGSVTSVDGTSIYDDGDYDDGDYGEVDGGTELFDSSVGYTPPVFAPNDDGLDFVAGLSADDVIDVPLSVTWPASDQETAIRDGLKGWFSSPSGTSNAATDDPTQTVGQEMITQRSKAITDFLDTIHTVASIRLKSMTQGFSSPYTIAVTELKVPTMIDLES